MPRTYKEAIDMRDELNETTEFSTATGWDCYPHLWANSKLGRLAQKPHTKDWKTTLGQIWKDVSYLRPKNGVNLRYITACGKTNWIPALLRQKKVRESKFECFIKIPLMTTNLNELLRSGSLPRQSEDLPLEPFRGTVLA